jgi:uncharacterized protein (TIGR02594 family)
MNITALRVAKQFLGIKEIEGEKDNPFVVWCLSTCGQDAKDEMAWCSAFVNGVCLILGLDRTNSVRARSWLNVGIPVELKDAKPGFDVCVFSRGTGLQGHVGFFAGIRFNDKGEEDGIYVLSGNDNNSVTLRVYNKSRLLGVRRLFVEP